MSQFDNLPLVFGNNINFNNLRIDNNLNISKNLDVGKNANVAGTLSVSTITSGSTMTITGSGVSKYGDDTATLDFKQNCKYFRRDLRRIKEYASEIQNIYFSKS